MIGSAPLKVLPHSSQSGLPLVGISAYMTLKNQGIRQKSRPPDVRIRQNFEACRQRTSKNNALASRLKQYTDNSGNAVYERTALL